MPFTFSDVLAGPILRRVDRREISVWIALRKPADVILVVYDGIQPGNTGSAALDATQQPTTRIGTELHIALVTLEIGPQSPLQSDRLYSYDLKLVEGEGPHHSLMDLGFLDDGDPDGIAAVALGYQKDLLPAFVLPPSDIGDLRLITGSCRLPHNVGDDQMVELDGMVKGGFTDVTKRPHQMFLTGDQVYADDVGMDLLEMITPIGRKLLFGAADAHEHLPFHHPSGQTETWPVPVTTDRLPPSRRQRIVRRQIGYSTGSGGSHVLGFGEYAALYLMVWSNVLWTPDWDVTALDRRETLALAFKAEWEALYDQIKDDESLSGDARRLAEHKMSYHRAAKLLPAEWRKVDKHLSAALRDGEWGAGDDVGGAPIAAAPDTTGDIADGPPTITGVTEVDAAFAAALTPSWFAGRREAGFAFEDKSLFQDRPLKQIRALQGFHKALPKVRRLLANVPTYMTFDDHEVTDDWNITGAWVEGVNAKPLGRAVTRNGLLAYALFQAWGNDPDYFNRDRRGGSTPGTEMMDAAVQMFLDAGGQPVPQAPAAAPAAELDRLFNIAQDPPTKLKDRVRWHYRVGGPGYEVLSLDSRTVRGFPTPDGPPELMTTEAIEAQIPADPVYSYGPPVGDTGVTFVIAPAPVLGFPPVEYVVQPLANTLDKLDLPPTGPFVEAERDYWTGAFDHDPEPWSYQEHTFEGLLARLAPYRRVVFISGDVHYACALKLDYWSYDPSQPAADPTHTAFVQATSSALKNQTHRWKVALFQTGLINRLTSLLGVPRERIGFNTVGRQPPLVPPPGESFNRAVEAQNHADLALFPVAALPEGTTKLYAPDFAWRLDLLRDGRGDGDRLPGVADVPPMPPDDATGVALTRPVSERVFWESRHVPSRVVNFFPNAAELKLDAVNGAPVGVTWNIRHALRQLPEAKVKAFTVVEASFGTDGAEPAEVPDAVMA